MDKLYYQEIHWYDFLIYLVYNIILSFLILRISDAGFNLSKKTRFLVLLQFQLLFITVILDTQFNFLPHAHDSSIYSSMIQSGQYPQESKENILPFYYATILINMISLNSVVIFMFISFLIFSMSMLFFADSIKLLFPQSDRAVQVFFIFNLLYPAIYLFFTSPSRDIYVLFAFSIFIHALVKFRLGKKIYPVIAWGIVLCLLSFAFIPFFILAMLYILLLRFSVRKRMYILAGTFLILCISLFVLHSRNINAEYFAGLRNETLFDTGNYTYGRVEWNNYAEMLRDEGLLAAQFLLAPLPVFSGYALTDNLDLLADLIVIGILILLLALNLHKLKSKYIWLAVLAILFLFYFGSVEKDLETAVRHRIPGIELILILVAGLIAVRPHANEQ